MGFERRSFGLPITDGSEKFSSSVSVFPAALMDRGDKGLSSKGESERSKCLYFKSSRLRIEDPLEAQVDSIEIHWPLIRV